VPPAHASSLAPPRRFGRQSFPRHGPRKETLGIAPADVFHPPRGVTLRKTTQPGVPNTTLRPGEHEQTRSPINAAKTRPPGTSTPHSAAPHKGPLLLTKNPASGRDTPRRFFLPKKKATPPWRPEQTPLSGAPENLPTNTGPRGISPREDLRTPRFNEKAPPGATQIFTPPHQSPSPATPGWRALHKR